MNAFKIIASALLLTTSLAFADSGTSPVPFPTNPTNPPTSIEVSIFANLNIGTCTVQGQYETCTIDSISVPNNKTLVLTSTANSPNEFEGYFATVAGRDGLRYIGVITVNYFKGSDSPGNPGSHPSSYYVTVEILGEDGPEAKMDLSVADPSQLNYATLSGNKKTMGNTTYYPQFSIGPAMTGSNVPPNSSHAQWNVIKGSLR